MPGSWLATADWGPRSGDHVIMERVSRCRMRDSRTNEITDNIQPCRAYPFQFGQPRQTSSSGIVHVDEVLCQFASE